MNEFNLDAAVVRWNERDESVWVLYPMRTICASFCPTAVIHKDGSVEQTHKGLLAIAMTRPGNYQPNCLAIFNTLQGQRCWRLNHELEHMIKTGRTPIPETTGEQNENQNN